MELTLDGRPMEEETLPNTVRAILEITDSLDDGELISTKTVADRCGVTIGTIANHATHSAIKDRRVRVKGAGAERYYYGNTETIEEARRRIVGG